MRTTRSSKSSPRCATRRRRTAATTSSWRCCAASASAPSTTPTLRDRVSRDSTSAGACDFTYLLNTMGKTREKLEGDACTADVYDVKERKEDLPLRLGQTRRRMADERLGLPHERPRSRLRAVVPPPLRVRRLLRPPSELRRQRHRPPALRHGHLPARTKGNLLRERFLHEGARLGARTLRSPLGRRATRRRCCWLDG